MSRDDYQNLVAEQKYKAQRKDPKTLRHVGGGAKASEEGLTGSPSEMTEMDNEVQAF
jgi:hypothetical protein